MPRQGSPSHTQPTSTPTSQEALSPGPFCLARPQQLPRPNAQSTLLPDKAHMCKALVRLDILVNLPLNLLLGTQLAIRVPAGACDTIFITGTQHQPCSSTCGR